MISLSMDESHTSTESQRKTDMIVDQAVTTARTHGFSDTGESGYPPQEMEYLATMTFNRAIDAYCDSNEALFDKLARQALQMADVLQDAGQQHAHWRELFASKLQTLGWVE